MTSTFAFVFGSTVKDLLNDYGVNVTGSTGLGMPPQQNITLPYAAGDGSYYQRTVVRERVIMLACTVNQFTLAGYHSKRKAVIAAINRDALASSTFILRYYGAGATSIDIPVRYNGGMEADIAADDPMKPFTISLLAVDPFWRTTSLATETFAAGSSVSNSGYIAMRDTTGAWTGLSGANSPAAGANAILYANSKLYVAAGSKLHVYASGTWTAYTANAAVNSLALAGDGTTVYVGGAFTTINSVSANYVAQLASTTFTALAGSPPAEVRSLVYVSGILQTNATGLFSIVRTGGATKLYSFDGSTWTVAASSTSTNNPVINTLVVFGYTAGYLAWYITDNTTVDTLMLASVGSASALPVTPTVTVSAVTGSMKTYAVTPAASYLGGSFTSITPVFPAGAAVTVAGLAKQAGGAWAAVASSGTTVQTIASYSSADYIGGTFTNYIVKASGWSTLNALPPAAVTALFVDQATGNLYASWNSASNMTAGDSLSKSITNGGDKSAFPATITITRTGGTSAILTAITNTYTGDQLLFNYALANGETVTIILTQGGKSITSSSGANIIGALLSGSAFSTWAVSPGTHTYNVSITGVGSPTVSAVLTYYPVYWSVDSIAA